MSAIKAVLMAAATLLLLGTSAGRPEAPRKIEITAGRFAYSPQSIVLKKGEPVMLVLRSSDVIHGLEVPELQIKSEIRKDKDTEVELTPEEVGHFVGKCAYFCGKGHGSMVLEIDVEP